MSECENEMTYEQAGHAIQTGVGFEHSFLSSNDCSPKHLRTGLNLRACDHAALVRILIAKGLFSESEYLQAIRDEAVAEVRRYEERLSARLGPTKLE